MLQSYTECKGFYRVLQSVAECCRVLQSVAECCRVLQSVAECFRVLQSFTECYRVLQSITECYRVLESISSASTWTNFWACFSENITEWFLTNGAQSFQHIFAITSKASFLEDGSLREGGRKGVKLSWKGGELGAETHGRQGVQV